MTTDLIDPLWGQTHHQHARMLGDWHPNWRQSFALKLALAIRGVL